MNNATCIDLIENYKCICAVGFTGHYCESEISLCANEDGPCRSKGNCNDPDVKSMCNCSDTSSDPQCLAETDNCKKNLCQVCTE